MKFLLLALLSSQLFAAPILPPKKPLLGQRTLACVAIQYPDNKSMSKDKCQDVAKRVAEFYAKNSRGKLQLKPVSSVISVDFPATNANLSKAEDLAKKSIKADYYIVPSLWKKKCCNHASGGIAHVIQLTGWVVNHEVGHLLGLGHTGRYDYSKDGKPIYKPYGDNDSVMGSGTGSAWLTGPQYYVKGWLPDDELQVYDSNVKEYELKQIVQFQAPGKSLIYVPTSLTSADGKGRPVFIGYNQTCSKPCVSVYFLSGGSSQKIAQVQDEFYDKVFTGLHIKILGAQNGNVKFSVDFDKSPVALKKAADAPCTQIENKR